jgi:sugar O-acyltransferase (sialic acid O-acetyltransferase NeuD family)
MTLYYIIIGGGGHAHDVYDVLTNQSNEWSNPESFILGFLDDDISKKSLSRNVIHLGPIPDYTKYMSLYGRDLRYVIAINSSSIRKMIGDYMDSIHAKPATIIHKTASISASAQVGPGCVLGPGAVITSNAVLGKHVHMNTHSSVNQGSTIGDYGTLSPGARVCGDVWTGECVQFGANSTVINMKNIGNNVILGAGAVVVSDIPDNVIAKGVPAKFGDKK